MKSVEFHPDAAEEAREAAIRYENIRAGLGTDFRSELDAALIRIQNNPLLNATESGAIRICPLQRFPYAVFYEDLVDCVWVAAVGHLHRRPGYWTHRRPG
jgi:hypothetical protein